MAKIVRLTSSNVKRLTAVHIEPNGSVVIIGGNNGQGKSSVLDSIMYALGGKAAVPERPVRAGEEKAEVVVDLDSGLRVRRTFTQGGGGTLTITDAGGDRVGSPQSVLDALCGRLTFDPLEYSRMKPEKQAEILRKLAGVDVSALDAERQRAFDARTEVNRDLKAACARLDAAPQHPDAPAAEVSVAELAAELERRQTARTENERVRDEASRARQRYNAARQAVDDLERALKSAREELARAEEVDAAAAVNVADLVEPDLAEVRERIAGAEAVNARVRANARRAELEAEVAELDRQAGALTTKIDAIDERKRQALAAAMFPVPGLGFAGDGVTLDGVPLEQASQAERLRVSVAIGLATNPELRVLLIREGAYLDRESLALVAKMAEEHDAQVWLERVGDGDEGAIIIEEGRVREAPAEPVFA